jgi:hypothetical protein
MVRDITLLAVANGSQKCRPVRGKDVVIVTRILAVLVHHVCLLPAPLSDAVGHARPTLTLRVSPIGVTTLR